MDVINLTQYFQMMFVLMAILGAIGFLAYAVQRGWILQNLTGLTPQSRTDRRLSVSETLTIDPRRRVVIVKSDEMEHVILLGMERETLLSSQSAKKTPASQAHGDAS